MSPHDLCKEIVFDLGVLASLNIDFMGVSLQPETPLLPTFGDIGGKLLAQANTALAPLNPLFTMIELLIILKDVLEAVATLNPFSIIAALEKFVVKLLKLRAFIPQLAIPRIVRGLVTVMIVFLGGLRDELNALIRVELGIANAKSAANALGDLDLLASIECAEINLAASISLQSANAEPLNRLMNIVSVFCQIVGLPQLPQLTISPGGSAGDAIAPIDGLIAKLTAVRDAIPV